MTATAHEDPPAVAIVGVAGRYPQAPSVDVLWRNLLAGEDCVREIPQDRWDWAKFADPAVAERYSYSRWGGFLTGADMFDAGFFGILPKDAAAVDPQERIFLECVWTLLEETGHLGPSTAEQDTGVFVGLMDSTYGQIGATRWPGGTFTGARSAHWSVANRVSYFFDFHGPSLAIDAACSSSLLSVYLAAESLRRGECAMAVAGGVNLVLHPAHYVALCAAGALARDGRCKVFDEDADGFVPGEGVGAVLLKPLDRAIQDQDRIWALVKGGSVRSEGRTMGYAVPSPSAQGELIATANRRAGVEPETISYVEAHGTGTALGDPIEIAGLSKAYGESARGAPRRYTGSIKSNVGHLEGAAGIAGLTKVLLQFRHGWLAPSIHIKRLNTKIDFVSAPVEPVREAMEWPAGDMPRRAAVSSFGIGGTDVHLVLEQHPTAPPAPHVHTPDAGAFLLSARNATQLTCLAADVLAALSTGSLRDVPLAQLLYTSQVGRKHMRERLGIVTGTRDGLVRGLTDFVAGASSGNVNVMSGRVSVAASLDAAPPSESVVAGWCNGAAVPWETGWPGRLPMVAFPGYPFARRRYWADYPDGRSGEYESCGERFSG